MRKALLLILIGSLALAACDTTSDPLVLLDNVPQICVRGSVRFVYEENSCQLGFNRSKAEFRMLTDNMSAHVVIDLDRVPTEAGEKVTAESIVWTTDYDIESRKNLVLEVLKLEDGNIWLWNSREQIAAVVRILE